MLTFTEAIAGYRLVVNEQFEGSDVDPSRWIPYYLPQWAGRQRSRARYRVTDGGLELFIAADQSPWLPEIEGDMRVSSLQTGCFAGPVGSTIGQHRNRDEHIVVEEQPEQRLITPHFGAIEMQARWTPTPGYMVALWMIGFEDAPNRSAEICVCEIFGSEAASNQTLVGMGVHPFGDPTIVDDFEKVPIAIDISEAHTYGVVWTEHDVAFYVDQLRVKHVAQSPQYPMQLMLNMYGFESQPRLDQPAPFVVDSVRVYQPAQG